MTGIFFSKAPDRDRLISRQTDRQAGKMGRVCLSVCSELVVELRIGPFRNELVLRSNRYESERS